MLDKTIDEYRKVRKLFGQKLAGIRAWLSEHYFKVTAVSNSGLQAVPKGGQLEKSEVQHITIWPDRARKYLLPFEAGIKLNNEVLKIALIFDSPEIPDSALEIYNEFPYPLKDQNDNLWWATKPYKFSEGKVRLEFVSNLDQFLKKEYNIGKLITDSCINVMEKLFTIIDTNDGSME